MYSVILSVPGAVVRMVMNWGWGWGFHGRRIVPELLKSVLTII